MKPRKAKYEALRVPCPRCGVYEWKPCLAKDGSERKAFHTERHAKVRAERPDRKGTKASPAYNKRWAALRARVFAEKGHKCEYCGADASHVDHQTPRARGGKDDFDNLVPCCEPCNRAKGMMTLAEWRP